MACLDADVTVKKSLAVPGLTHYLFEELGMFEFITYSRAVESWARAVFDWMESNEEYWKERHASICISYLQRFHWLLMHSSGLLETATSGVQING